MSQQKFFQEMVDITLSLLELKEKGVVLSFVPTGSALIEKEGFEPKDLDILVLVSKDERMLFGVDTDFDMENLVATTDTGVRWKFGDGWESVAGEYDDQDDSWFTLRRGDVNLIVTNDPGWYERMDLSAKVVQALGLTDKGDRIVVHRVIRDGYTPEQANARRDGTR